LLELIREIVNNATAAATVEAPPTAPVRTGESPLQRAAGLRDVKDIESADAKAAHHDAIVEELDQRAMVKAHRKDVPALLDELADRGFSWRDIARMAGVSVPAVRKWREGGTYLAERRRDLARVAGLCDLLDEYLVPHPAGWLEMALVKDVPVTWMDIYLAGREELLIDAASNRRSDLHGLLDELDPEWRERYRSDYEVFEDIDGRPAIRAKR
jgi:hypothetical protein